MTPNQFKTILAERPEAGLSSAAHRARDAALAASDRVLALAGLAALVGDRSLTPRLRAAALLGAVCTARIASLPLPPQAYESVEDPLLVDAALQFKLTPALTGALFDLPDGAEQRRVRRGVGRRLFAAGVRGPHVTRLLFDAGETETAVRAAVEDFLTLKRANIRDPNAHVFAEIALEWLAHAPEQRFAPFRKALAIADPTAPARLAALIDALDNASPALRHEARQSLLGEKRRN